MADATFDNSLDFKEDSNWLGVKCQEYIESLPPPLNDLGREYLRRAPWQPFFDTVLPFWVGDIFRLPRNVSRSVALPSCLAWFCVRLQDNIMDESGSRWANLSPFGTVVFTEMMRQYRAIFPGSSSFWSYLEQYVTEWMQSVSWEQAFHWNRLQDYSQDDLWLIARKAAMFKLSAMPVALLAQHEEAVEPLAHYVDCTQVVFDFIDQLRDWRQDLQDGHYGYLLTKVMLSVGWSDSAPPTEDFVRRAFALDDTIDSVISVAAKYSQLAVDCAVHLKGRCLISYANSLARHCKLILSQIAADREQAFKDIVEA